MAGDGIAGIFTDGIDGDIDAGQFVEAFRNAGSVIKRDILGDAGGFIGQAAGGIHIIPEVTFGFSEQDREVFNDIGPAAGREFVGVDIDIEARAIFSEEEHITIIDSAAEGRHPDFPKALAIYFLAVIRTADDLEVSELTDNNDKAENEQELDQQVADFVNRIGTLGSH